MTSAHTATGLLTHTPRTLAAHAVLEVPVLILTGVLIAKQRDLPLSANLAHIVSMIQTVGSILVHATWLTISSRGGRAGAVSHIAPYSKIKPAANAVEEGGMRGDILLSES